MYSGWRQSECEFNRRDEHEDLKPSNTDDCCAWTKAVIATTRHLHTIPEGAETGYLDLCGVRFDDIWMDSISDHELANCCGHGVIEDECDMPLGGRGPAFDIVADFARSEKLWLKHF